MTAEPCAFSPKLALKSHLRCVRILQNKVELIKWTCLARDIADKWPETKEEGKKTVGESGMRGTSGTNLEGINAPEREEHGVRQGPVQVLHLAN